MLSWVEHEKSFITSGPGLACETAPGKFTLWRTHSKDSEQPVHWHSRTVWSESSLTLWKELRKAKESQGPKEHLICVFAWRTCL